MSQDPTPLHLVDAAGNRWTQPHLTCSTQMFPAINRGDPARGAAWWWHCQTCHRFIRPLNEDELRIIDAVLRSRQNQVRQKLSRIRKRSAKK